MDDRFEGKIRAIIATLKGHGDKYDAIGMLEDLLHSSKQSAIEMKLDGVIGTGRCHLCLRILGTDEMKPGGVHYCPGVQSSKTSSL